MPVTRIPRTTARTTASKSSFARRSAAVCLMALMAVIPVACSSHDPVVQSLGLFSTSGTTNERWPSVPSPWKPSPEVESQIDTLLSQMTLEQKVGQMMQAEIKNITPDQVREYHIGSVLNGGGSFPNGNRHASAQDWLALADAYHNASIDTSSGRPAFPLLWGTDAVHGHSNVYGATIFPHNIGLGATDNPELIEAIAAATAKEVAATGIKWAFAPTVAVARDLRWGRAYESFTNDPAGVKLYSSAAVKGLQGDNTSDLGTDDRLIATAKHFIADGGTLNGVDQGDNTDSR